MNPPVSPFTYSMPPARGTPAFALVSTLLIIAVLTIMVVAFMQSMRIDRLTARSYLEKTRAELAAVSGANDAVLRLQNADLISPVTTYEEQVVKFNSTNNTAPYLSALQLTNSGTNFSVATRRYMVSTTNTNSIPTSFTSGATNETCDINAPFGTYTNGLIGLLDASTNRRVVPVEWVYITNAAPHQISRYAYWVDDDSAKIDISVAGTNNATNTSYAIARKAGVSPAEIGMATMLSATTNSADGAAKAFKFLKARSQTPSPVLSLETLVPILGTNDSTNFESIRGSLTDGNLADERGSWGYRKLNLNDYVTNSTNYTTPNGRAAIVNHVVALGDYINATLPNFGKRYYNDGTSQRVSTADMRLYCVKIAANIQDYIDEDSQPTVISQNLDAPHWVEAPGQDGVPLEIGDGAPAAPPAIFGKEVVPAIDEYVGFYYTDGGALRIDHSFEAWNIYNKAIDFSKLGDVKILMAERNAITPSSSGAAANIPGGPGNTPLTLNVSSNNIPGATYGLFTTLPSGNTFDSTWVTGVPSARVNLVLSPRETTYPYPSGGWRMEGDVLATSADATTEIVVVNKYGYLDIEARIPQQGAVVLASGNSRVVAANQFGNVGASSGNNVNRKYPLDSADPRSLTEVVGTYSESAGGVSALAFRRNTANTTAQTALGTESFGITVNNTGAASSQVPEPMIISGGTATTGSAARELKGIAVLRDGKMKTIGELGFIYDPAIESVADFTGVRNRGGFRTLSIGSSRGETATNGGPGALTHLNNSNRSYQLMEIFSATNELRGRLNINSALRDPNNLPLKALFESYATQNNTTTTSTDEYAGAQDPSIAVNSSIKSDQLIVEMLKYLRTTSPNKAFLAVGELADLDVFNPTTANGDDKKLISGVTMAQAGTLNNADHMDRGREEVFRNLVQMLTLKGSIFSIYVVAQSGDMVGGKFVPHATARLVKKVELNRVYPVTDPLSSFVMPALKTNNFPTSVTNTQIEQRFIQ